MGKDVDKKLIESMDVLLDVINGTKDFATEQAPLFVQEWIDWQVWSSVLGICLGISLVAFAVVLLWFANKTKDRECQGLHVICLVFGLSFAVFGPMIFTCSTYDLIKVKIAPRVAIVDYLKLSIK